MDWDKNSNILEGFRGISFFLKSLHSSQSQFQNKHLDIKHPVNWKFLLILFRFLLGTASPVLYKILYSWDEEESNESNNGKRQLILCSNLEVSLTLVPCFEYHRLELEGIPPIAVEALLEYIYKDMYYYLQCLSN